MSEPLEVVYYRNAMRLLAAERRRDRRINEIYCRLRGHEVKAELSDWLANPFVRTALLILEKFQGSYKISQAIKLLREAGEEAQATKKKKGKK